MTLRNVARSLKNRVEFAIFTLRGDRKETFECPVCGYTGPFMDVGPASGVRKHAKCPKCGALERHRIQFVVLEQVLAKLNTAQMRMLHFAPEPFFRKYFRNRFGRYETADLKKKDVDHNVDLQNLPFVDASYDFVFASHVLEHIRDDEMAISEIRRILRPEGVAVLPVPIVAEKTVEYPKPNPHEAYHVRAPGFDYFDRYERYFSKVEKYTSDQMALDYQRYQLFVYEDRSRWPSERCPWRPPMQGERHVDIVPVCYV